MLYCVFPLEGFLSLLTRTVEQRSETNVGLPAIEDVLQKASLLRRMSAKHRRSSRPIRKAEAASFRGSRGAQQGALNALITGTRLPEESLSCPLGRRTKLGSDKATGYMWRNSEQPTNVDFQELVTCCSNIICSTAPTVLSRGFSVCPPHVKAYDEDQ